jgi:hypothetical protein
MNKQDLVNISSNYYAECKEDCLCYSIICIWECMSDIDNLELRRDVFFTLIRRLLDDDVIVVLTPFGMESECRSVYDRNDVWIASHDRILDYMKSNWPHHAQDSKGDEITNYMFDTSKCPWIGWLDHEDQTICCS